MNKQVLKALVVDDDVPEDMVRSTASRLKLPVSDTSPESGLFVHLTKDHLELVMYEKKQGKPLRLKVDFTRGKTRYRIDNLQKELLLRAIKIHKKTPDTVIDTTGGLGRDAFLLASAGCRVHVCEHNPFVAALLGDGLRRAKEAPSTTDAASRIHLHPQDAVLFLQEHECTGAVIYLDPMFPVRRKSAKVKQDIRLLQYLSAYSYNEKELFAAALSTAAVKVVVKRPAKAGYLQELRPAHSLKGKTVRFDVYVPSSISPQTVAALLPESKTRTEPLPL